MAVPDDGFVVVVGVTGTEQFTPTPGNIFAARSARVIPTSGAGTVWTWGWKAMGQLGDGSNVHRTGRCRCPV